jgi:hypothetical protein
MTQQKPDSPQVRPSPRPGYAEDLIGILGQWLGREPWMDFDDGCRLPFLPPHRLHIWSRPSLHTGELFITNGFGAIGQPKTSHAEKTRYIELAAVADAPVAQVAPILLVLARTLHVRGTLGLPARPWRIVALPAPVANFRRFLLVPLINKTMQSGRVIRLLQVIPLLEGDKIPWIRRFPTRWLSSQNAQVLCRRWKKPAMHKLIGPPEIPTTL